MKRNLLPTLYFFSFCFQHADFFVPESVSDVLVCPKNQNEVNRASNRLGCGRDKYGHEQYLCLPNNNKTSLVEFCFDGVLGIRDEGICLELLDGKVVGHSCENFSTGCPTKPFYEYEFFKYPSCQTINSEFRCYVSDPFCPNKTRHSHPNEMEHHGFAILKAVSGIAGILIPIVSICIIVYCIKKKSARNERNYKQSAEKNDALFIEGDKICTKEEEALLMEEGDKICTEEEEALLMDPNASTLDIKDIRIVLLGKTGTGKSATGNSILGEPVFQSRASGSSISDKCAFESTTQLGCKFLIVDTPGIFDTSMENDLTQKEICKCIALCSPGPHAFIFVLSIGRHTEEEQKSIEHYIKYFGEKIFKYVIILFTRKDDLDIESKTLKDYIDSCPRNLIELKEKCKGRVIAFNNRLGGEDREKQVKTLLEMIIRNVKENEQSFYTNKMYEDTEKLLMEREKKIRKKAKEEHKRTLREIEETAVKRFKLRYQDELKEIKDKQWHNQNLLSQLAERVKENEKQLKEIKPKYKVEGSEQQKKLENEIERLKEKEKEIEIRQMAEITKLKRKEERKYQRKIATIRDEVRKNVDQYSEIYENTHLKGTKM